jgi:hypothetical protein
VSNDLDAIPVAPGRTQIRLFTGGSLERAPGTPQGFIETELDDRDLPGLPISPPIQEGVPPFQGRHKPQQPLSVLLNKASAGTYQLIVRNKSALNSATLDKWTLSLERVEAGTGLGEPFGDLATVHFNIFSMDPTNRWPSRSDGGRPGVAEQQRQRRPRDGVTVDPLDVSGNTVTSVQRPAASGRRPTS